MTTLPWFGGYGGQSLDELLALEGQFRTDSLLVALESALDAKASEQGGVALSSAETVVLAVQALEREVYNGGYWQFFANSSAYHVPWIVESLELIGCRERAALTRTALSAYGVDDLQDWEVINAQMESTAQDAHDDLDQAFFASTESIGDALFAFIKANRDTIHLP